MADTTAPAIPDSPAAVVTAAPVKATKKAVKPKGDKKPKVAPSHPTYSAMIKKAIVELKERGGSSKAAILKFLIANNKLGDNVTQINAHLRLALKRGVTSGALKQTKGTGASGSFKIGEKKEVAAVKTKTTKVTKKAVAKKEKKPAGEKKTTKPKAKKTTKPKAAAKAEKKPKSPKKTKASSKKAAAPKKKVAPKNKATPKAAKSA